jgi:hypothetical protein
MQKKKEEKQVGKMGRRSVRFFPRRCILPKAEGLAPKSRFAIFCSTKQKKKLVSHAFGLVRVDLARRRSQRLHNYNKMAEDLQKQVAELQAEIARVRRHN